MDNEGSRANMGELEIIPFESAPNDNSYSMSLKGFELKNDECHEKVISSLKKRCSEATELDMSKMAVHLYNCQALKEERQTFQCTESMSLAQCTRDMDPTTWNTYHIISNRARRVCYTVQSQLYRKQTEQTIAKLSQSAFDQLNTLKGIRLEQQEAWQASRKLSEELQSGQRELVAGQESVLSQQLEIQENQQKLESAVTSNIKLIEQTSLQLEAMKLSISESLNEASKQIQEQHEDATRRFEKVMKEIDVIQVEAGTLWGKIEEANQQVISHRKETDEYYRSTISDLQKINATIKVISELFQVKLDWMLGEVAETSTIVKDATTIVSHALYLVSIGIIITFLGLPLVHRLLFIFLIFGNLGSQIWFETCLSLRHLSLAIAVVMLLMTGFQILIWKSKLTSAATTYQINSEGKRTRKGLGKGFPSLLTKDSTQNINIMDDVDEHDEKAKSYSLDPDSARRCIALSKAKKHATF